MASIVDARPSGAAPPGPAAGVDVDGVLDGARFAGLPLVVMICTAAVMVLDGFDIQIIGLAAPSIAAEFGITRAELAPALAASLIGMAIGSFALGPVGDRWGRRTALLLSVALFGLGTLAAATSASVAMLTFWRFLTGIGLGGALPNATALMAEFAPPRVRSQTIAAAIVGVPVGGMIGALIAADLVPAYGWRALFVLGGTLPLIALLVLWFVLPESARFLAARRGDRPELARLLNRIVGEQRWRGDEDFRLRTAGADGLPDAPKGGIFARGLRGDTFATWVMFGTNMFAVYCFFNWAPVMLTSLGLDLPTAVRGLLVFNAAGVVGALLAAWVIARIGSRWPATLLGVIGAAALWYVGSLIAGFEGSTEAVPVATVMGGIALAGFAIVGVQVTMYGIVAHVYPTHCRSAGVGWAAGFGRLGGVLSAFVGAALMDGAGVSGFFLTVTGVLVVTVVAVIVLKRHVPPAAS